MIYYYCSDGSRISQGTIDKRYTEALKEKHLFNPVRICECCEDQPAVHNDHTVAKARLKQLHKTELIYDPNLFVSSCEKCHKQWESWKSGYYLFAKNIVDRMVILFLHDFESFTSRVNHDYGSVENNKKLLWVVKNVERKIN